MVALKFKFLENNPFSLHKNFFIKINSILHIYSSFRNMVEEFLIHLSGLATTENIQ